MKDFLSYPMKNERKLKEKFGNNFEYRNDYILYCLLGFAHKVGVLCNVSVGNIGCEI